MHRAFVANKVHQFSRHYIVGLHFLRFVLSACDVARDLFVKTWDLWVLILVNLLYSVYSVRCFCKMTTLAAFLFAALVNALINDRSLAGRHSVRDVIDWSIYRVDWMNVGCSRVAIAVAHHIIITIVIVVVIILFNERKSLTDHCKNVMCRNILWMVHRR